MEEKIIIQEKGAKERTQKYFKGILVSVGVIVVAYIIGVMLRLSWSVMYVVFAAAIIAALYNLLCYLMSKCEIVVTTHRVYGRGLKEQVDLPLDSISAVKKGWFRSIVVATSSGKVAFFLLSSQEKIFAAVSDLLKERQNMAHSKVANNTTASNADEMKKYKELLDSGVITQEEFDAKKKQLLGL